jgi:hypothetical protein
MNDWIHAKVYALLAGEESRIAGQELGVGT